jgi:hypothetical protein
MHELMEILATAGPLTGKELLRQRGQMNFRCGLPVTAMLKLSPKSSGKDT